MMPGSIASPKKKKKIEPHEKKNLIRLALLNLYYFYFLLCPYLQTIMTEDADSARKIEELQRENERLRNELETRDSVAAATSTSTTNDGLTLEEYRRYGRQLIMKEIGKSGQLKLKGSKILVVGAGGLGCPVLAYLAGAGVGTIGIVDNDIVDSSNLHRQILHDTTKVGISKAESCRQFIGKLNPNVQVIVHDTRLSPENVFGIFSSGYTLILDCTDTPNTRYLISDTAVILGIPLVSASALKTEGQLSVLNFRNGPCYRCFFPVPPPPDSVLSCGDGGILGPVVGVMGVMQSIEAIKVSTGAYDDGEFKPSLTMFSAYSTPQWRNIKMRGKKPGCVACGENPTVTRESIESGETNYTEFCGRPTQILISPNERVSVREYSSIRKETTSTPHTLIDVREKPQFDICSLDGAINKPFMALKSGRLTFDSSELQEPVYICCRYGNDSQAAVKMIKEQYGLQDVWDVQGGLDKWSEEIDTEFPRY